MRRFVVAAVGVSAAFFAGTPHADTITDWNVTAVEVMKAARVGGNPWSRTLAMVHVAMADAVNSVQNRYTRTVATMPLVPGASSEAAAAAAARQILIQQYPGQKAMIEDAYAASLKAIAEGPAKAQGIALGEQVAAAVLADRAADGTSAPDEYRPVTSPGVWVPTTPPLFAQYARAKPWVVRQADQFRPGPPPVLSSAVYARDYNENKKRGRHAQHCSDCRANRRRKVLDAGQPRAGMAIGRAAAVGRDGAWRLADNARACSRCSTWPWPIPSSSIGTRSSPTTTGVR